MPVGEITAEVFSYALRFIGHILIEVILDIFVRGAGYLISRQFHKRVDPDDGIVLVVGILFWLAIIILSIFAYSCVETSIVIDANHAGRG